MGLASRVVAVLLPFALSKFASADSETWASARWAVRVWVRTPGRSARATRPPLEKQSAPSSRPSTPPAHSSIAQLHRGHRRRIRIRLDKVGSPSKGLGHTGDLLGEGSRWGAYEPPRSAGCRGRSACGPSPHCLRPCTQGRVCGLAPMPEHRRAAAAKRRPAHRSPGSCPPAAMFAHPSTRGLRQGSPERGRRAQSPAQGERLNWPAFEVMQHCYTAARQERVRRCLQDTTGRRRRNHGANRGVTLRQKDWQTPLEREA